jgi:hypothetical protein
MTMATAAYTKLISDFPNYYMHLEMDEMRMQATVFVRKGSDLTPYTAQGASMAEAVEAACNQTREGLGSS